LVIANSPNSNNYANSAHKPYLVLQPRTCVQIILIDLRKHVTYKIFCQRPQILRLGNSVQPYRTTGKIEIIGPDQKNKQPTITYCTLLILKNNLSMEKSDEIPWRGRTGCVD